MEISTDLTHAKEKSSPLNRIQINRERCKGCGYCPEFCPRGVLRMSNELGSKGYNLVSIEDQNQCTACGLCEVMCPDYAILVTSGKDISQDYDD